MSNSILKFILFSTFVIYLTSGCALLNEAESTPSSKPLSSEHIEESNNIEPISTATPLSPDLVVETQNPPVTVEEVQNLDSNNLSGNVMVSTSSGELLIDNQTESLVYYAIFETSKLSIIEWGPCEHPDNCEHDPIGVGQSLLLNSSQVADYLSGKTELTIFHWNLIETGSRFVVENLESVSIIP